MNKNFSIFDIKIDGKIYTFIYKDQILDTVLCNEKPVRKPWVRWLYNYCLIISSDKSSHRLLVKKDKDRVEKALKEFYILNK